MKEKYKRLWESCSSYVPGRSGFSDSHEQWCLKQFEAFARDIRNQTLEDAANAVWSNRWEPPYTIENRAVKQILDLKEKT